MSDKLCIGMTTMLLPIEDCEFFAELFRAGADAVSGHEGAVVSVTISIAGAEYLRYLSDMAVERG